MENTHHGSSLLIKTEWVKYEHPACICAGSVSLLLCLNDRMENIYINFDVPCFHVQYHVVCVHVQYHVCVTVNCHVACVTVNCHVMSVLSTCCLAFIC